MVHCHASNATCYVLLCYWRIIDVALASRAHPCNEPTHIASNPVYRMRLIYTRLVYCKKHVCVAYSWSPRKNSSILPWSDTFRASRHLWSTRTVKLQIKLQIVLMFHIIDISIYKLFHALSLEINK